MAPVNLPPDFKEFLRLLNDHRVEYLLIGGYAVAYYGYPRATADMDIWIAVHSREASSLPVEDRVVVIDSLLQNINSALAEVEAEWIGVVKRRLTELRLGRVKAIPGDEVIAKIQHRFEK